MPDINFSVILGAIAVIVGIYVVMWIFMRPVKVGFKILVNGLVGAALLIAFNYIGAGFNMSIGVNIYTALVCGLLGLPGFLMLLVLRFFVA